MNKRFVAGRRTRALAFGAWALPLGAAVLAAATVAGCPGPEPHEMAASGTGGSTASGGGTRATGSVGGATTTDTGLGGDVAPDGGMGGGGGCPDNLQDCNGVCVDLATDIKNCGSCGWACGTNHVVPGMSTACTMGVCTPTCQVGWVDDLKPLPPGPDDGCETPAKRVFVTSLQRPSLFNPSAGNPTANQVCNDLAATAGFGVNVTWKAWFSSGSSFPANSFNMFQGDYVLVDGKTIVARGWQGLTTPPHLNPIDMDENEMSVPLAAEVWTGTLPNGMPSMSDCVGWGSPDMNSLATVGQAHQVDHQWTQSIVASCNAQRHLYCFEQ